MLEDLNIVRLNVRHYEKLLAADCSAEQRQQLLVMLANARTELRRARAQAAARTPPVD
ncbi:MAG TPA: hypothetical protein VET84_03095 [Stellaceae bacterium]|jgi:hypothetical protein|nr:hypothetical protein [Stellaceae bacterium]